jgi:NAD(P)-dependent dehydrogenase (short-subunit alcohol dehydrogenase family)
MERIAVVTGADRGLGLALTAGLLNEQWRVFAGQYMPDWPELGDLASRHPSHLTIFRLDVSSQPSVQAAAQAVSRDTSRVDLLIKGKAK